MPQKVECRKLTGGRARGVPQVEAAYRQTLPLVLSLHFLDGLFNVFKSYLTIRKQQACWVSASCRFLLGLSPEP